MMMMMMMMHTQKRGRHKETTTSLKYYNNKNRPLDDDDEIQSCITRLIVFKEVVFYRKAFVKMGIKKCFSNSGITLFRVFGIILKKTPDFFLFCFWLKKDVKCVKMYVHTEI